MTTSLMPMDPALSPQQVTRLLAIRADLLPDEITSRRDARRMRAVVVAGVVLVIGALGGWSADVHHDNSVARQDRAAVNSQIHHVEDTMNDPQHSQITQTINQNKAISDNLKTLMANDLRWSALVDRLRSTGTASNVEISRITAALAAQSSSSVGGASSSARGGTSNGAVATLALEGSAKDKKTIADFIVKLAGMPAIGDPYLTSATKTTDKVGGYMFTINADVSPAALCGRFTTTCPAGGY